VSKDERIRRNATYRIDSRIADGINEIAARQGVSANSFIESHFISYLKKQGVLTKDFEKIGDGRGKKSDANIAPGKRAYILIAQSIKRKLTSEEIEFVIANLPEYQFSPKDFLE
jgi:hypothetical protein